MNEQNEMNKWKKKQSGDSMRNSKDRKSTKKEDYVGETGDRTKRNRKKKQYINTTIMLVKNISKPFKYVFFIYDTNYQT